MLLLTSSGPSISLTQVAMAVLVVAVGLLVLIQYNKKSESPKKENKKAEKKAKKKQQKEEKRALKVAKKQDKKAARQKSERPKPVSIESPRQEAPMPVAMPVKTGEIVISHHGNVLKRIRLGNGERFVMGRQKEYNDLAFPEDNSISSQHCYIEAEGEDLFLVDNNSSNGTLYNGRAVSDRVLIANNSTIAIGNTQLIITFN